MGLRDYVVGVCVGYEGKGERGKGGRGGGAQRRRDRSSAFDAGVFGMDVEGVLLDTGVYT